MQTITVSSRLPDVLRPLTLDARTQPGYAGAPLVELSGGGTVDSGLFIQAPLTLSGLAVYGFTNNAIFPSNAATTIKANYVGLTALGQKPMFPNRTGILVSTTSANPVVIGGLAAADRNVISGQSRFGVLVSDGSGTQILGNFVGTNAQGTAAIDPLDTAQAGVFLSGGSGALVEGNVVSGNLTGISCSGSQSGTTTATIKNNLIGTDASGAARIGNRVGVSIGAGGTSSRATPSRATAWA